MNYYKKIKIHFIYMLMCIPVLGYSQDDLLDEIDTEDTDNYVSSAFKDLKVVNFESTKLVSKKELTFIVAHRFGSIDNGFETFFGLDDAVTRLNFVYGITDAINVSVSRSSLAKVYQGAIKYRLFRQEKEGFPITIVGFNEIFVNTALDEANLPKLEFNDRLSYSSQLLISRKFTKNLSLLIAPTFFHDNYIADDDQDNSQFALGMGGRYKIGKRWSFNMDYGWHLNRASSSLFNNPLSIGFDLETGGHVFQMHLSNAQGMNTNAYLGQATGDWSDRTIYFGFNLSRRF